MNVVYIFLSLLLCALFPINLNAMESTKAISITLSDGIKLQASIYLPNIQQPAPVIVQITPYGRKEAKQRGEFFSLHDYVFIAVDSRGTGDSQGQFVPFANDGKDGYDVIEWAAKQPFSNAEVATLGGSYRGFTQWAITKHSPPSLKSMIAIAPVYPGIDFPLRDNIYTNYAMSWLNMVSREGKGKHYVGNFWDNIYLKQKNDGLAFADLEKLSGNDQTVYQTWLQHPSYDKYWQDFTPKAQDYKRINMPILSITGHYDGDQRGTLSYYRNHQKWGDESAFNQHYLVIGPWDHAGTRHPKAKLGDLVLGQQSMLDMDQIYLDWFNWTLKDGKKPNYLQGKITKYIQKLNQWHVSEQLEQGNWRSFYFSKASSHLLTSTPPVSVRKEHNYSEYFYDPNHVISLPSEYDLSGETPLLASKNGSISFETEKLTHDLLLSGQIHAQLWLSINVPDTDFHANVFEVCPNTKPLLLTSTQKRAKYRNSLENAEPVTSTQAIKINMNNFDYIERLISKGCKVRFTLSSTHWYFQKHFNGASAVAQQTSEDGKLAHIILWHNNDYPSYIRLPELKPIPSGKKVLFPTLTE
ncbi:CocE/NonD family hydrolase [Pseudoalteromonas sp. T1lg65]|uniref:CocE/NonD family hydrolase n=1 Tax=Pseudoalteromonas sp. T1lg65 TaxID=2077101 RepID=UPI003F7A0AA3